MYSALQEVDLTSPVCTKPVQVEIALLLSSHRTCTKTVHMEHSFAFIVTVTQDVFTAPENTPRLTMSNLKDTCKCIRATLTPDMSSLELTVTVLQLLTSIYCARSRQGPVGMYKYLKLLFDKMGRYLDYVHLRHRSLYSGFESSAMSHASRNPQH